MLSVFVNNSIVCVSSNSTVLQACEKAGFAVPRFCYHSSLIISGNCRMCLVELIGSPKPVASCSMPVIEGMQIFTDSPLVKKSRESVLEFLLINHPLDCPICDQGGECDLQDQAKVFGSSSSRFFYSKKRGVSDKNLGPLIKTVMTRCIHCTRCIRFSSEIAGISDLGTTGRGNLTEVGSYIQKTISSELSGNLVDICPVGALTSKVYAFKARPWEITYIETFDLSDFMSTPIKVEYKGLDLLRVLPSFSENLENDWFIHDKTRFCFDGFKLQRITKPLLRGKLFGKTTNKFFEVSWSFALTFFIKKLLNSLASGDLINGVSGSFTDIESSKKFKLFCSEVLGSKASSISIKSSSNICINDKYSFNSDLAEIKDSDLVLIVGTNIKKELPLLEARLRKNWLKGKVKVFSIGIDYDTTFPVLSLGVSIKTLINVSQGSHPFAKTLIKAKTPFLIVQSSLIRRDDFGAILNSLKLMKNNFLINSKKELKINFVSHSLLLHELGYSSFNLDKSLGKFLYLFNLDSDFGYISDFFTNEKGENLFVEKIKASEFLVYQGHHGGKVALVSDLVIPSFLNVEIDGYFFNFLGKVFLSSKLQQNLSLAKSNCSIFEIITFLFKDTFLKGSSGFKLSLPFFQNSFYSKSFLNKKRYFNFLNGLVINKNRSFSFNGVSFVKFYFPKYLKKPFFFSSQGFVKPCVLDFYRTDIVSRNSRVMVNCSIKLKNTSNFRKNLC